MELKIYRLIYMRMEIKIYRITGLLQRLKAGERILVGEGYIFELERRGYVVAGAWIPECLITHPERVRALQEEYVHVGSDVVVACTVSGSSVLLSSSPHALSSALSSSFR